MLRKVAKIYGRLYVGGKFVPPTIQTSVKFRDFEELYILVFNKSFPNLAILLILRRSFEWCRRIFPNLSMSKVEKKNCEKVYVQSQQ